MLWYVYLFSVFISVKLGFMLGRRVLIFPKGNNVDYLSMYLDVADSVFCFFMEIVFIKLDN